MERKFDAANKTIDRALKLAPDSFSLWSVKAQLEISGKGTFEIAERGVEKLNAKPIDEETRTHLDVALSQTRLLQRRYAEALQLAAGLHDEALKNNSEALMGKYGTMGIAKKLMGDDAGARESLTAAKGYAEKWVSEAPNEAKRHDRLAEALAWLGEKDVAIAEAKRAMELLPERVDAFEGPVCTQTLAEIYMVVGEYDKAIEIVDGLLSRPTQVTVATLKVNPLWDPVRQDPRFIAMLRKHGG
jgi:serine/threonine-protein kinase